MATHRCNKEVELKGMQDDLSYIKKTLAGNGEEGLIRQAKLQTEAMIRLQGYSHIKTWVLGMAVTLLVAVCSFLATRLYSLI